MELTIYIDVLWLRTFFVELLVCLFVNVWMKQDCPVWRIFLVNVGSASAQILLFVLLGYDRYLAVGGFLLRAAALGWLFRPGTCSVFVRLFLWSMAATAGAGGILSAAQAHLPKDCWFPAGSALCGCGMLLSLLLEERRRLHDAQLYRVTLRHGAQTVETVGLYDTGNRLMDPYVHAPVCILAQREYESLLPEGAAVRLLPFSTVGAAQQLMEVVTVDAMEWKGGRLSPVVVGKAADAVFAGKDYHLILPAGWHPQT